MKDFWPISLLNGVYKNISKVLANHTSVVMDKIILKSQNVFVRRRQIVDLVLVANEYLESKLKLGEARILIKLDTENTFDHVYWDFLFYLFGRSGFGEKWQLWIKNCISTLRFSILVNGSRVGFFNSSYGLRQGDHFSTVLCVIVMDTPSRMIDAMVEGNFFSGFMVGNNTHGILKISHILFADDILIFS